MKVVIRPLDVTNVRIDEHGCVVMELPEGLEPGLGVLAFSVETEHDETDIHATHRPIAHREMCVTGRGLMSFHSH